MLPKWTAPYLLGVLLSGVMSFLVSGISTYSALGAMPGFFAIWMGAWVKAWAIAFPTLVIFRPVVTRIVGKLVAD